VDRRRKVRTVPAKVWTVPGLEGSPR